MAAQSIASRGVPVVFRQDDAADVHAFGVESTAAATDDLDGAGRVVSTTRTLTVSAASVPGLKVGATASYDGAERRVRAVSRNGITALVEVE